MAPEGYLGRVLAGGARPFRYRSGAARLLGAAGTDGPCLVPVRMPGLVFAYLRRAPDGARYQPEAGTWVSPAWPPDSLALAPEESLSAGLEPEDGYIPSPPLPPSAGRAGDGPDLRGGNHPDAWQPAPAREPATGLPSILVPGHTPGGRPKPAGTAPDPFTARPPGPQVPDAASDDAGPDRYPVPPRPSGGAAGPAGTGGPLPGAGRQVPVSGAPGAPTPGTPLRGALQPDAQPGSSGLGRRPPAAGAATAAWPELASQPAQPGPGPEPGAGPAAWAAAGTAGRPGLPVPVPGTGPVPGLRARLVDGAPGRPASAAVPDQPVARAAGAGPAQPDPGRSTAWLPDPEPRPPLSPERPDLPDDDGLVPPAPLPEAQAPGYRAGDAWGGSPAFWERRFLRRWQTGVLR
ncbi:hypothetical protein LVY72_10955 [Arthrobacter sp. I2-34]|uniref:Uncharacterized protein n=1 Tax=Arthrobacter hankyongi TaxID=2904801 RepID=A0ABS9L734_9MICC|nr:hypothetical protein [Arthrobacter hankyongi]MCG2622431.1 hypothetical protein [Arthrobacter hankyongi]